MEKSSILFLLLIFCGILSNAQIGKKVTFNKESFSYKIDTSIIVAVPYKSNFFCLKSSGEVIAINNSNLLIDHSYSDNSKVLKLQNLFLIRDTLVGVSSGKAYYLKGNSRWVFLKDNFEPPPLFEDNKFIATSTCSGEWGGSIYFKDKMTNKIYEAGATCVVNIIKFNGKYNVTATLAHLAGFGNVFEIENPLRLAPYNKNRLRGKKKIYVGDNESRSTKGVKQLIDTIGVNSVSSFIYGNQIYYLITKRSNTSIAIRQDNKFVAIDKLDNAPLWSYNPITRFYDGKTVYSFSNYDSSGFLEINKNNLRYFSFDWKHK